MGSCKNNQDFAFEKTFFLKGFTLFELQAGHTEIIEILNVIVCGVLALHVITAAYTNYPKKVTFLYKPTEQ